LHSLDLFLRFSQFIVAQFTLDAVNGGPSAVELFGGLTVRVEKLQIVETRRILSVIRLRRYLHSLTPRLL